VSRNGRDDVREYEVLRSAQGRTGRTEKVGAREKRRNFGVYPWSRRKGSNRNPGVDPETTGQGVPHSASQLGRGVVMAARPTPTT
jgi:hypothetical protein